MHFSKVAHYLMGLLDFLELLLSIYFYHINTRSYLKNGKLALKPELEASAWNLQMNNGQ